MLVKVGVYCLRGEHGHWACYDDPEAAMCGTKGPDVYIDVDVEDMDLYPAWLQAVVDEEIAAKNTPGVCVGCGADPARGFAQVGDDWYCHDGPGVSCYEKAGWSR